jgi:hypothetical protein
MPQVFARAVTEILSVRDRKFSPLRSPNCLGMKGAMPNYFAVQE